MRRMALGLLFAAGLVLAPDALGPGGEAHADRYDPQRSGHPLRILAYALHPAGVILDTLIFRPAHWLAHEVPGAGDLFGHSD